MRAESKSASTSRARVNSAIASSRRLVFEDLAATIGPLAVVGLLPGEFVDVGQGPLIVFHLHVDTAAIQVAQAEFGIDADGLVEVRQGLVEIALGQVYRSAIVAAAGALGIELERAIVVAQGQVELFLL